MTSIKFQFDQEIRRVTVVPLTYAAVALMIQKLFPALTRDSFTIHWTDEDGDEIRISTDVELEEALKYGTTNVPKFTVRKNQDTSTAAYNSSADTTDIYGNVVHEHVTCDECGMSPIRGIRYKCTVRDDFDMCSTCEGKKQQPFPVLKITTPQVYSPFQNSGDRCDRPWRRGGPHYRPPHGHPHGPPHGHPHHGPHHGHPHHGPPHDHHGHPHGHPTDDRFQRKAERCGKKLAAKLQRWQGFNEVMQPVLAVLTGAGMNSNCNNASSDDNNNNSAVAADEHIEEVEVEFEVQEAIAQSIAEQCNSPSTIKKLPEATALATTSNNSNNEGAKVLVAETTYVETMQPAATNLPKPALRFVKDISMPDGSRVSSGTEFNKIWRIRNDGPLPWPTGCQLVSAGGDVMVATDFQQPLPTLQPDELADITVTLVAPEKSGMHQAFFRAQTRDQQNFGQRLWATVLVVDPRDAEWDVLSNGTSDKEAKEAKDVVKKEDTQEKKENVFVEDVQSDDEDEEVNHNTAAVSNEIVTEPLSTSTANVIIDITNTNNGVDQAQYELWRHELNIFADMGFYDFDVILPLLKTHLSQPMSVSGEDTPRAEGMQLILERLMW